MNYIYKLIALVVLVLFFGLVSVAKAGGPWSDQYCNITHETVITKNEKGEIINKESCKFFTWKMPMGQKVVEQRGIACKRMDGGYEIVQGYYGIN